MKIKGVEIRNPHIFGLGFISLKYPAFTHMLVCTSGIKYSTCLKQIHYKVLEDLSLKDVKMSNSKCLFFTFPKMWIVFIDFSLISFQGPFPK